ncbi:Metallo-dependent phosphatase-like protein [Corynascus novoguineensis]|uniref:Metallo-dependent phosphatase-like protein n=1 Tax=Corynascus novoguineensis TaxID=1126955 RepID=A0AAN7CRF4_9PEZI|nr:Metallo-dependent phosphatase-like protein [Corynascus novoguineensis]
MAPQMSVQALPGHRRMPSRLLVLLTGGLALLTFCFFTSHLPVLRHFTSARLEGNSWMTSPGQSAAPPYQHHHQDPSPAQVLLDLIEREKAKLLEQLPMEYGANKHPSFKDDPLLLIGDLPPEHIPTYTPPSPLRNSGKGEDVRTHGKRLVIVGDVHGHLVALETLLRKIDFDHRRGDHLVLAGDMITKGPDSKGVVQLAMDIGASAVRGNQDDKVLAAAREMHRFSAVDDDESRVGAEVDDGGDDEEGVVEEKRAAEGEAKTTTMRKSHAHQVARSLTRSQLAWIRSHPLILRIGHMPDATAAPWNASMLLVIHGGLVPGVPLENQDPWAVMNMRSLLYPRKGKGKKKKGGNKHVQQSEQEPRPESTSDETETDIEEANVAVVVPIDRHKGEPWSHAWNRYQNTLPPTAPRTVAIYGHDAKVGLQVNPIVDISPNSHSSSSSKKKKNKHKNKAKMEEDEDSKHHGRDAEEDKSEVDEANKREKGLRYAFGLDSGCGNMKQLTALVLEAGADGIQHRIEQVDCAKLV